MGSSCPSLYSAGITDVNYSAQLCFQFFCYHPMDTKLDERELLAFHFSCPPDLIGWLFTRSSRRAVRVALVLHSSVTSPSLYLCVRDMLGRQRQLACWTWHLICSLFSLLMDDAKNKLLRLFASVCSFKQVVCINSLQVFKDAIV